MKILRNGFLWALCFLAIWGIALLGLFHQPTVHPSSDMAWILAQKDLRKLVIPSNKTLLLSPSDGCNDAGGKKPFLVIIVCSAIPNFVARYTIRNTWGQFTKINIKMYFMIGKTGDVNLTSRVLKESERYSDIIQEDFLDSYNNLTIKSVMLLKWVNNTCLDARYIMKTDDDMFVNVFNLLDYLKKKGHSKLLLGCLISGAVPVRDRRSKWYIPDSFFTANVYPDYLSGTGYVFSTDIVPSLYETALDTPFFYLEDIFITGICASKMKLSRENHDGFKFYKRENNPCIFKKIITSHKMSVRDLRNMWSSIQNKTYKC
ncbi:beta-1,3-galactosyltransferase 1-like isoform X1 [Tachypleus tridentatus]|uniref:beta-1,3-galactosyltransferase 1-like isoform X1 n=1 Tax=Tachypleus tridentatus TaxID=6853 RepID=UPI003FD0E957